MAKNKFTMKKGIDALKALHEAGYQFIADDYGHNSHKAITVGADGTITTLKVSSLVNVGMDHVMTDISGKATAAYKIDGELYTCNDSLGRESKSLLDSYQYSNENLALFSHCAERLNLWDKKLIVATTLPVKRMESDGNMEKVLAQFKKPVVRLDYDGELKIVHHMVVAEGQAAFWDWALNYDGSVVKEATDVKTAMVIDIGGSTTDIATITIAGQLSVSLDKARCFNFEGFGLVALKDEMSKIIKSKLKSALPEQFKGAAGNIAANTIDNAFDTGFISNFPMHSAPIDISKEVLALKNDWVDQLIRLVIDHVKRLDGYNKIIIAGGGAVALEREINSKLPGCAFLDEYANVNGLAKLLVCLFSYRLRDKLLPAVVES